MSRLREIAELVAERHGLTVDDLRGRAQERRVAWPRQEAFALLMDTGAFTPNRIALYFDRDRSTVLKGVARYRERLNKAVHTARIDTGKSTEMVHA